MLYQDKHGNILTTEEVDKLSTGEIQELEIEELESEQRLIEE